MGPIELMVVMIIMLVVVAFGGGSGGPRPPGMRRLTAWRSRKGWPLLGFSRPFIGVGACARAPFCFFKNPRCVASPPELCYHSLHIV